MIQGRDRKCGSPTGKLTLPGNMSEETHGSQKAMNRANLRGMSRKELLIQLLEHGTDQMPIDEKSYVFCFKNKIMYILLF